MACNCVRCFAGAPRPCGASLLPMRSHDDRCTASLRENSNSPSMRAGQCNLPTRSPLARWWKRTSRLRADAQIVRSQLQLLRVVQAAASSAACHACTAQFSSPTCHDCKHCSRNQRRRRGESSPGARSLISDTSRCKATKSLDEVETESPLLRPLLLGFFASQKRSSFAARSLVQTVLQLYRRGRRWEDLQLELKLVGMQEGRQIDQLPAPARVKARLLVENDNDVLVQWIALIYMTLKELGMSQESAEASALDGETQMARGMRTFVRQTLDLGFSLEKLELQQRMAEAEGGGSSPSVRLMQENARLIVLTSEILKGSLEDGSAPQQSPPERATSATGDDRDVDPSLKRAAATALLAFMGAAKGSLYSVNALLEEVFSCYRKGWTAKDICGALAPQDFATGKTLFPVATLDGSGRANADIFAQWVSTIYITLAQVGVPHPAAAAGSLGWAWAGSSDEDDAIAASRISHFVSSTLERLAAEEGNAAEDSEAMGQIRGRPPEVASSRSGQSFVSIEDPSIRESSSALALMAQLLNLVVLARDLAERTRKPSQQS